METQAQEQRSDMQTVEIQCESCSATISVDANAQTARCPYCDSPSIIEHKSQNERQDPHFVVGFVLDQAVAAKTVARWIKSRGIFTSGKFKKASVEKTRGVYLPAYIYGAIANSNYQADIGENYTVTETYTTTDSEGKTVTRTRTKTKTEYRDLSGMHSCYVLDVIVTASRGISNDELESIEPFDLRALRRYAPAMLAGWAAETPSMDTDDSMKFAHDESVEYIKQRLPDFMPGDSHSNLRFNTSLSAEVIDLVMLPIWIFAAHYDSRKPPVRVLVNGQTGKVSGKVPLSWIRITAAIILGIITVVSVFLLIQGAS